MVYARLKHSRGSAGSTKWCGTPYGSGPLSQGTEAVGPLQYAHLRGLLRHGPSSRQIRAQPQLHRPGGLGDPGKSGYQGRTSGAIMVPMEIIVEVQLKPRRSFRWAKRSRRIPETLWPCSRSQDKPRCLPFVAACRAFDSHCCHARSVVHSEATLWETSGTAASSGLCRAGRACHLLAGQAPS